MRIDEIGEFRDSNTAAKYVCALIDSAIHRGYEIFPINYVAYDTLHSSGRFAHKYTEKEKEEYLAYFDTQLTKIDVDDITEEEKGFMKEMILIMYANPLKNKLKSILGGFE
ncbi:MAG: hypothetical protein K2L00_04775 [Muribaculaceae bacterium]|nr:hypothetical protein [Muribaculaceae bacterium]